MNNDRTLDAILDAYEPASFAERQAVGAARTFLCEGVNPTDMLADLERKRELVDEWTALEQQHGVAEALKRWGRELEEWWEVTTRGDSAEKAEWILAHPICAPLAPFLSSDELWKRGAR